MASLELPAAPLCCGATLPACSSGSLVQVDFKNKDGKTAMMNAAEKGHEVICKLLLDRGAEVTAALNRREGGRVDRKGCLGEDPSGPRPHTQHWEGRPDS